MEEFLEDINNMLNSGEVPNLFEKDELEQVLAATRPRAKEAGIAEGNRDEVHCGPCQIHPSTLFTLSRIGFVETTHTLLSFNPILLLSHPSIYASIHLCCIIYL